jgi:hypothetical protein
VHQQTPSSPSQAYAFSLEINPKVMFSVDGNDKITNVVALNEDADVVLSGDNVIASIKGKQAGEGAKIFVDYCAQLGYLDVSSQGAVKLTSVGDTNIKSSLEDYFRQKGAFFAVVEEKTSEQNFKQKWNIDTTKIVACGSSAGAITALQAEYMLCNGDKRAQALGEFNYAGVVSFAGAIFSVSGKPKWDKEPCPVLLFHGNADSNVPYNKASAMGVGFFGSKFLTKQFEKMDTSYWFYSAQYRDHSMAGDPMYVNLEEIKAFINRVVVKGEKLQIVQQVVDAKHPKCKTRFSVKEYLGSNYK